MGLVSPLLFCNGKYSFLCLPFYLNQVHILIAVIWDLPLIKRSARNEIISVFICVVLGFIIGKMCHLSLSLLVKEVPSISVA
jgi:hypothetical protein